MDVSVHRLGGAFGGKIHNGNLLHGAVALAAWKFKAPVTLTLTLPDNMALAGWRDSFMFNYKVIGSMGDRSSNLLTLLKPSNTFLDNMQGGFATSSTTRPCQIEHST